MSIPFEDHLHNVTNYGDPSISDQLKFSCFSFFDYALLNAGAFTNISFPTGAYPSGIGSHSSAPYFLRSSRDPRYASGQVWEGFKNNWVWETGISRTEQPIRVSGVYINDTFYSTGTVGATGFKIIHPEGRIIFNSPIPTNSQVKCQFSYKNVKIAMADAPWFQAVQFDSLRPDSQQFKQPAGSGSWDVLSANRVQLPAIVIDSVPRVLLSAFEMGSLRRYHRQELAFHIFTETAFERDQLHDIIINQWDRTVVGISKKNMMASGVMPLSYDGTINPSGLNYRQAIDSVSYRWNQFRFEQVRSAEVEARPPMYRAIVKALLAIDGY